MGFVQAYWDVVHICKTAREASRTEQEAEIIQ
jgi:hypothetical protein